MNYITVASLRSIMPLIGARADMFVQPLNDAMEIHEINTTKRQAAFLAQVAHESGEFRYMKEIASGAAYENRNDLGNVYPGDGVKFKGRGPIQTTGRANYAKASEALYGDDRLLHTPEILEQPFDGCMASAYFWKSHGLNEIADAGDFRQTTKVINGGYTHQAEREAYYARAVNTLGGLA